MSAEVIMMTPPDPERLAWYEMNDLGNAERLQARSGGLLVYVTRHNGTGFWSAWDGKRWNDEDGERRAAQAAHDVARAISSEVSALSEQIRNNRLPKGMVEAAGEERAREMAREKLTALHKWSIKSGNAAQTRGMLTQAANEMAVSEDIFDRDPLAFNCQNKTLRFVEDPAAPMGERWSLRVDDHEPADRITRLADVEYDPKARCAAWEKRLELVQPDEDQRRQLQVLCGYILTGRIGDQQFYLNQGPGGDGKSATWSIISNILGDYHRRAKVQTFLEGPQRSGSDHSSDLARLSGDIRLVTCSEPPKRSKFNTNTLKEVTGGDKVTARGLNEREREFHVRWKLIIECNGLPGVPVSDDGWWRRCRVIPWPFQFAKMGVTPEKPEVLHQRLMDEAPGILNWMIEGALAYLNGGGVPISRTTKRATDEYRRSSDPFDEWYLDRCVTNDRAAKAAAKALYDDFKQFSEDAGLERVMTQKTFGLKLAEKQHERHKSNGNIMRIGIRLKTPAELAAADRAEEAEDARAGIGAAVPPSNDDYDDDVPPGF